MIRHTLFAAAATGLVGLAFCAAGCQNSGEAQASVDADRPQMAAETTTPPPSSVTVQTNPPAQPPSATVTVDTDPASYTVPYTATTDTPYMRTAGDTTSAGTLRSGDTVYLRSGSPTSGIVPAKTADGRIVYVRASDLRAKQ